MAAKQLIFSEEARRKLQRGVDTLANAVATTLGPKGRNVALDKKFGAPTITHDGVTVAKEIELEDPYENMGAQLLKEAASKTNDIAGDGTTTSTVLAHAIVTEGLKTLAAGFNPMMVKRGIEQATDTVVEQLRKMSQKIDTKEEIGSVATNSAADSTIGELIADVMDKVGKDGVITVEESKSLDNEVEYVEGMMFDRGYIASYFITSPDTMEAVINEPYILIHDKKISAAADIVPVLEKLVQIGKRDLVIIAEDVDGEALATLVLNKLRGMLNVLAVKAPGFGDRRKAMLGDIAVLTGGTFIAEDLGRTLESVEISELGRAKKVVITKDNTTVIEGAGKKSEIQGRAAQIKAQHDKSTSDYDREKLMERLAKLTGGVAMIKVGGASEIAMKALKDLVDDALHATRAAAKEGYVPGGGVALLRTQEAIEAAQKKAKGDEKIGFDIVAKAVEACAYQIAENAGYDGDLVVEKIKEGGKGGNSYGFNAATGDYTDLVKDGIIDPALVAKSALINAASVAGLMLTTDVLITELKEDKAPAEGAVA